MSKSLNARRWSKCANGVGMRKTVKIQQRTYNFELELTGVKKGTAEFTNLRDQTRSLLEKGDRSIERFEESPDPSSNAILGRVKCPSCRSNSLDKFSKSVAKMYPKAQLTQVSRHRP